MRISDWSSDVCSSDLRSRGRDVRRHRRETRLEGLIRLAFARAARHDLDAIIDYIALDDPAAAEKVFRAIVATARRLPRFPELGRAGRLPGTREFAVTGRPYLKIGRASWRDRVGQTGKLSVDAVLLKKTKNTIHMYMN